MVINFQILCNTLLKLLGSVSKSHKFISNNDNYFYQWVVKDLNEIGHFLF